MVEDKHPYIIENSVSGNTKAVVFRKNENIAAFSVSSVQGLLKKFVFFCSSTLSVPLSFSSCSSNSNSKSQTVKTEKKSRVL